MTLHTARDRKGHFVHSPNYRPVRHPELFSDEDELDRRRVIDDVRWRNHRVLEAERAFERQVMNATSGPETARPAMYEAGGIYRLNLNGVVTVRVKLAYSVGVNWHYQLELTAVPGACCQMKQVQLYALHAQRGYRGYETDLPDTEWGAGEYAALERKDRIAAA